MGPRSHGGWSAAVYSDVAAGAWNPRGRPPHGRRGEGGVSIGNKSVPVSAPPPSRSGIAGLEEDLDQTEALQFRGRSLPYVRAARHLRGIVSGPDRITSVAAALERVWAQREFHTYFSRPFLLLAALRAEALASADHPLARGFASRDPDTSAVTREALVAALSPEYIGVWVALATRSPQTNDVSRAVVWKWPAELAGLSRRTRPLALVDVGASGGLNLIGDRLNDGWTDGSGVPLRVVSDVDVCLRLGFDLRPLDFLAEEDVAWGRACIWPGAAERAARFERAVEEWRKGSELKAKPIVHKLNAAIVPGRLPDILAKVPETGVLFVYQTLIAEYMERAKRKQYEDGMRRWLAPLPPRRAVWVEAESAPDRPSGTVGIDAHVPDGSGGIRTINLGWTSVHPTSVHGRLAGAREFTEYFATT